MSRPAPETIRLTPAEIQTLTEIAAQVGSLSRTGTTAGKPSWRTLIKDLANHKLKITTRTP